MKSHANIRGFALIEVIVTIGLLGVVGFGIMSMANYLEESSRLTISKSHARGVIDKLDSFVELRLSNLFSAGSNACSHFSDEMNTAFDVAVLEGENLAFELTSASNLASPPANLLGARAEYLSAWDSCVAELPETVNGNTLNFCVTVTTADSSLPPHDLGLVSPTFAKVTIKLLNSKDNSPVNCPNFDGTLVPARLIKVSYTLFWLERAGDSFMVVTRPVWFLGSLNRAG